MLRARTSATVGIALALLLLALAACAPAGRVGGAREPIDSHDLEGARRRLEQERQLRPRSVDVRVELGEVYYRIARDALDRERDEARYLAFFERSQDEFLTAVEIDPSDERPHFYLGMIDIYRGEMRKALRNFRNFHTLNPSGVAKTNLAEVHVYIGNIDEARHWNDLGLREHSMKGPVVFVEMLISWRSGDLRGARRHFDELRSKHPEELRTINTVRLTVTPPSFEDFAGYCCQNPECGPYMKDACKLLSLSVQEREISEQTVLRELRLEIERERRLRKVYEQRKELEITIEEPSD